MFESALPIPEFATERRITLRLLGYWERLRGVREMPEADEIVPEDIDDLWDWCFVIKLIPVEAGKICEYSYLGPAIVTAYHGGLSEDDPKALAGALCERLSADFAQVADTHKPLLNEGEFTNAKGALVKYRQCLLPLGKDGVVDAIFGGMRYRVQL